jgi:hypothetical protein
VGTHRWVFKDGLAQILGFVPNVPYEGVTVASPNVCVPLVTEAIHVKLVNLPCLDEAVNMTNVSGMVMPDTTLGIVPVTTTTPFHVVSYTNDTDVGMWTGDYKLNVMEFHLMNEDGLELSFLPDWWCTLKIETYDMDEQRELLNLIRQMQKDLNDLLMHKVLRPR